MWIHVEISGIPPPSRLDHAMCSIKLPVPSPSLTGARDKTTPSTHIKEKATQLLKTEASHSGGSLTESSQSSLASFQAVTVIDPEDSSVSNFSVSEAKAGCVTEEEQVSGQLEGLSVGEGERAEVKWVDALFVFGGMDTAGIVHGDAFVLVP